MEIKNKRSILSVILTVLISVFLVATSVFAVTTLGTNISTGGNLTVSGTAAITGNTTLGGTLAVTGDTTLTGDLAVNGGDITTTATTFNLINATATTVNLAGAATILSIGAATGTTTVNNALTVTGALTANGDVTLGDAATDDVTITGAIVSPLTLKQTTANYTLQWSNPAAARTLTIPDPGANDTFVLLAATQTLTNKTLTAPDINGGTADSLTSLSIRSSGGGAFDLTIANIETLTAGKTLTIKMNDTDRTVDLGGNLTLGGAFTTTGAWTQTGAYTVGITTTGNTTITLPTSGTLLTNALTSGNIFVGNASNVATGVAMSGDVTIDNTGATTIGNDKVTAAKILQGTAGQILMSNATPDTAWTTMSGDAILAADGTLTIAASAVGSSEITDDSIVDADINSAAAIANTKLANPKAYYTVSLTMTRQLTATLASAFLFRVPVDSTLVSVGASARASGGTSPTLTVDVNEAGVSVLSAAFSVTAGAWSTGTISNSAIAAANNVTIDFTIGGTSPTWDDITVLLTFKTAHTN